MSQPPKSTIFAPSARWVSFNTVFFVIARPALAGKAGIIPLSRGSSGRREYGQREWGTPVGPAAARLRARRRSRGSRALDFRSRDSARLIDGGVEPRAFVAPPGCSGGRDAG